VEAELIEGFCSAATELRLSSIRIQKNEMLPIRAAFFVYDGFGGMMDSGLSPYFIKEEFDLNIIIYCL
jgi:hypothetical protein